MVKAKVTYSRYDTTDYLKTEEDIALYMEAVMEECGDDASLIVHVLGDVARARNMSQLARDVGMTREGLYKALSSEGNPSFAMIMKVAKALGLKLGFKPIRGVRAARRVRRPVRRPSASASRASWRTRLWFWRITDAPPVYKSGHWPKVFGIRCIKNLASIRIRNRGLVDWVPPPIK